MRFAMAIAMLFLLASMVTSQIIVDLVNLQTASIGAFNIMQSSLNGSQPLVSPSGTTGSAATHH